jgi:hypothetical protein
MCFKPVVESASISSILRAVAMAPFHKDDPAVVAVALNVSNILAAAERNKSMQAGQQQPKVVDQEIAGMAPPPQQRMAPRPLQQPASRLPEEQGIAQLQAPNLERMADGGIAGYADGGGNMAAGGGPASQLVFNNEPVMRMAGGGEIKKYAGVTGEQLVRTTDGGQSWWLDIPAPSRGNISPASSLANRKFTSRDEAIAAYNAIAAGGEAPAQSSAAPVSAPADTRPVITPYGQTKIPTGSGNPPPPPPPAPLTQQGLGSISIPKTMTAEQAKEQAGQLSDFSEARTAMKQAELDQETQGARMRTMLTEGLPKTPALQGLEALLDKQDAASGGEKDKAAGLALVMAGLGIAGGSSPIPLQNLKEAIPAVKEYGDALKDFKKMERENMKLRGDIEQARRAEDSNNLKLKLDLEDKIGARKDKLNDMGINLLAKVADTDTRTATELWTTSSKNAAHIQAAVAGAQAHSMGQLGFLEKLGAAPENSALRKGYDLTQQDKLMFRARETYEKMAADSNPTFGGKYATKGEEFKAKYPTLDVYMASMPSTTGGSGQIYSDNNVNPSAVRTR